jgi:predicted oxidoreductase
MAEDRQTARFDHGREKVNRSAKRVLEEHGTPERALASFSREVEQDDTMLEHLALDSIERLLSERPDLANDPDALVAEAIRRLETSSAPDADGEKTRRLLQQRLDQEAASKKSRA